MIRNTKIVEVMLRYEGHIFVFMYNIEDVAEYKKSLEYITFKSTYGDILTENNAIDNNKEIVQTDYHIFLSIADRNPCINNFSKLLNQVMGLFDIPHTYVQKIRKVILESFQVNTESLLYHTVAIVNSEFEQNIIFDFKQFERIDEREYFFHKEIDE